MSTSDAEPVQPEDSKNTRKERPTGDMLYELFPKHVADQLKAGLKVEPEQHDNVTVIFSDVVHFDELSRKLPPLKISNMLDRLYLAFDNIAKANQVFKVETIGDCYMGVCNLEKDQEATHVKHAAEFAVDLIDGASKILIDEEKPELGCLNVRVGFHSGPVVSNVIGSLNPRYCLFGDTVNTAARMGTNSRANRILCAQSTFELLADQAPGISAKKRGKIFVKGKGDMFVYW
jgi:class 3 adenylate cyclase